MQEVFRYLLNWSEFWATLIPISVFILHRKQPSFMRPILVYIFFAMVINFTGNIISATWKILPLWMQSNTLLYNIHSIVRFICFIAFFMKLKQPEASKLYRWFPVMGLILVLLNFIFVDDFFNPDSLSGNLLAGEAYLLLISCMLFYFFKLRENDLLLSNEPEFWVATGLAIYVVVNFFVFLFYGPMLMQDVKLALKIWDVHNYAYIILCLFIAKAIYDAPRYQYSV